MKFLLTLTSLVLLSEHALSTPLPKPQHAQVHVDLIDTIFQIPIQTLNAVGNLLKNVHTAKRNFLTQTGVGGGGGGGLSINVQVGNPMDSSEMGDFFPVRKPSDNYPPKKPASNKPASGYPTKKPLGFPTKPPSSYPNKPTPEATPVGFPDYQPAEFSPMSPESFSVRPVSGVVTQGINFPEAAEQPPKPEEAPLPPASPSLPPTDTSTLVVYGSEPTFPDLESASSAAPPSSRRTTKFIPPTPSRQPSNDRVPPAPAVQPTYRPSGPSNGGVQPLSLDVGGGVNPLEKESTKEKNFKDYVARKLAEKNLQDNRISHTF
ncbi:hypothetical protein WDU94_010957 [Cyamophila willieti]